MSDGTPLIAAYVAIAEFEVAGASVADFIALAQGFSDECIESEPGCWQFDVVQLQDAPSAVVFYAVYDDAAAFAAHSASPHRGRFRQATSAMVVAEKPLRQGLRGHTAG